MDEVKEEQVKCNMKGRIKKTNQAIKTNKIKRINGKKKKKNAHSEG